MSFLIGSFLLIFFIVLGVPIGYALGIAGVASMLMLVPSSAVLTLMTNLVHEGTGNYVILTIPMFVLMAEFLSSGGITQDLMMACVLSGAVLAAASGSSTASAAFTAALQHRRKSQQSGPSRPLSSPV